MSFNPCFVENWVKLVIERGLRLSCLLTFPYMFHGVYNVEVAPLHQSLRRILFFSSDVVKSPLLAYLCCVFVSLGTLLLFCFSAMKHAKLWISSAETPAGFSQTWKCFPMAHVMTFMTLAVIHWWSTPFGSVSTWACTSISPAQSSLSTYICILDEQWVCKGNL